MVKLNVELRLIEVESDLSGLKEYYETLESQISHLAEHRRKSMYERLRALGLLSDPVEVDLERQVYEWEVEHGLPKSFRGSFIVLLWATYESGVMDVARFLQRVGHHALAPEDLTGGVLDKMQKYYAKVLHFPLHPLLKDWSPVRRLYAVRNAIAHANGRISMMTPNIRKSIKPLLDQDDGLQDSWGYIIPTTTFVEMSLRTVNELLGDLVARARIAHDAFREPSPS
jgi:hypothetical protein